MRDDDAPLRELRRDLGKPSGNEFIRQAVKAVAPHALVVEGCRQGECIDHARMAAMKRRVETRDLRRAGKGRLCRADAGQIVRLVQGGKRLEPGKGLQQRVVDDHGIGMVRAAVNHPVADGADRDIRRVSFQDGDDGAKRGLVTGGVGGGQHPVGEGSACIVMDQKMRIGSQAVDLSPKQRVVSLKQLELDR